MSEGTLCNMLACPQNNLKQRREGRGEGRAQESEERGGRGGGEGKGGTQ